MQERATMNVLTRSSWLIVLSLFFVSVVVAGCATQSPILPQVVESSPIVKAPANSQTASGQRAAEMMNKARQQNK